MGRRGRGILVWGQLAPLPRTNISPGSAPPLVWMSPCEVQPLSPVGATPLSRGSEGSAASQSMSAALQHPLVEAVKSQLNFSSMT